MCYIIGQLYCIEHLQQVYNTKLSGEGTVVSTLNYDINGSEFKPSRGRMFIPICYLWAKLIA